MLRPVAATENLNSSFEFSRHFSVLLLQKGKGNSILKNKKSIYRSVWTRGYSVGEIGRAHV